MSKEKTSEEKEIADLENAIQKNYPDFEISTAEFLGEGWMSRALLVNGEWVFRFPKKKEAGEDLEKELRSLPEIRKNISVAIPQFDFIGKQDNGLPFVGYKILPGELMEEEGVPSLQDDQKEKLAQDIAKFISDVSSFPVERARELKLPEEDYYQDYNETFEEVKEKVFPLIDQRLQNYISSRFTQYLETPEYFKFHPTVIHADLSPNHFIIDPQTQRLSGIIDFGDLNIGDPDFEFVYLLEDCGEDFTRRVMEILRLDDVENRLEKISLFVTVDNVGYILEGIDRGDEKMIQAGIKSVENEMHE